MAEIPNIKPNSKTYNEKTKKADDHRLAKVTKGTVKKTQQSSFQKFAKAFVPEDSKSIKDYVVEEAPGLIITFLRRLFQSILDTYLPDNGKYTTFARGNRSTNTSIRYDTIRTGSSSGLGIKSRSSNTVYEYENVIFDDYSDAQLVLDQLFDCLSRYEKVSVFDFYDLAGVSANASDRNYGWPDLGGSKVVQTVEGFVIDLPRAVPLT